MNIGEFIDNSSNYDAIVWQNAWKRPRRELWRVGLAIAEEKAGREAFFLGFSLDCCFVGSCRLRRARALARSDAVGSEYAWEGLAYECGFLANYRLLYLF